jgi:hypothetical protein
LHGQYVGNEFFLSFSFFDVATAYGVVTVYWRESGPLDYMYGIYRKLRFSFMVTFGGLIGM